jgi:hypothetical protein
MLMEGTFGLGDPFGFAITLKFIPQIRLSLLFSKSPDNMN